MLNEKVIKILDLDKKIEDIAFNTTSSYSPGEQKTLNVYDKKVIEYYEKIIDLIIELTKEEGTKEIKIIDNKYFDKENTAGMMIESSIAMLQFYRQMNNKVTEKAIAIIHKLQNNLKLDAEFELNNQVELADCYFALGDEKKARKLLLDLITKSPDEDEPYMCMQNWYMHYEPNINKLAEVIDLAHKNNHTLITDFGYARLVEYYGLVGDTINKNKYQALYNEWKKKKNY